MRRLRRRTGRVSARLSGERGVGLTELMVSMTLMVTVFGVFGQTLIAASRAARVEREESESVDSLRTVLAQLERELRWAQGLSDPPPGGASGSPPSVAGRKLTFNVHNGVGGTSSYTVTYELVAVGAGKAELRRTEIRPPAVTGTAVKVAGKLVDSATPFTYFPRQPTGDRNGYVDVVLKVQMDPARSPRELKVRITARNIY